MNEWHKQARKMLADGMTVQAIAHYFHVSYAAARYAVSDEEKAAVRTRILWQTKNGDRAVYARRYYEKNAEKIAERQASSYRRRKRRMLAVAREYGCGDSV